MTRRPWEGRRRYPPNAGTSGPPSTRRRPPLLPGINEDTGVIPRKQGMAIGGKRGLAPSLGMGGRSSWSPTCLINDIEQREIMIFDRDGERDWIVGLVRVDPSIEGDERGDQKRGGGVAPPWEDKLFCPMHVCVHDTRRSHEGQGRLAMS